MKIEENDFACVTKVEIVPLNSIPNELALASNVEIKPIVEAAENNNEQSNAVATEGGVGIGGGGGTEKVPYILNGELYQILSRNGENVTVKCCYCPAGRFYRGSVRSTGNFHMHIKRRHPYLLTRLHDMKVASLVEKRDRLTQNRRTKLRRINQRNNAQKFLLNSLKAGELGQDLHKLKIKRAFQRHQAEAKEHQQHAPQPAFDEIKQAASSFAAASALNQNPHSLQQHSAQLISYASSYDGSAYNEFSSPKSSQLAASAYETEAVDTDDPLDLSLNASNSHSSTPSSPQPLAHARAASADQPAAPSTYSAYSSSGIDLGPMYSDTTVANTVSTTISAIKSSTSENHLTATMFHNCDNANWQRLSMTLHDIHEDMRVRNRIEHNRLLLDIAKFKFLNPGFYFNLQN